MKKKTAQQESKSLKTFYLYAILVGLFICISLALKGFFIFEQSKFDPAHDFTIAVTQQGNVKEVIAFHTQTPSMNILLIEDKNIPYNSLAKLYGIATQGYIQEDTISLSNDVSMQLWGAILHTAQWQSNLTVIDKIRLLLIAKSVATNNKTIEKISLLQQSFQTNTVLSGVLNDQDLATENVSIQIVNATTITGFGQRLGRVLTNIGANVVDVSSDQNTQKRTSIAYFGNSTYTLERLQKLLGVRATLLTKQTIANIIVTLGTDKKETTAF